MRDGRRWRVQGVTYGPFAPNAQNEPFPSPQTVRTDFKRMQEAGVNAIRTYHFPPAWFLDLAEQEGIAVLADTPWPKHLCFLDDAASQREARRLVREAAQSARDHSSVFALSIGNEIPADIVRWHGARRVERFVSELADIARQVHCDGLVTFASYPPTEYLDLSFLDFSTFNVYLHDADAFERYLFRLQNLCGERPLLLGEIGMDTLRYTEQEQADFLGGHLRKAFLAGLAGAFVFSWTDDWFTGGHQIEDWAFGITHVNRSPKTALLAVHRVLDSAPSALLARTPRVSVVVCSYNGGNTLEQCLKSLLALDYPDYEVILVDDGSTDATPEISARFPGVKTIRQSNQGLSMARNVGLQAATGEIVAYTDSDCFADPHWLSFLVHQLERSDAAGVGGPNLTPDDGWLASCVSASPGQPAHVLEGDQMAEHIPGCNMAFWRASLLAINGFDPLYRKAGDDVDICWRLQEAGGWITFAPGAFVWHHRRHSPRAYLKQQAGYGEAEALLVMEHPARFNGRGQSMWKGAVYGSSAEDLRLGAPVIYRGTFGSGLFQTMYQAAMPHWATLPSTLEWHLAALAILVFELLPDSQTSVIRRYVDWVPLHHKSVWTFAILISLALGVAVLRAVQATIPAQYDGFKARLLVTALCYAQPLVRSWSRYRARWFPSDAARTKLALRVKNTKLLPFNGRLTIEYWDEQWRDRTELLQRAIEELNPYRCVTRLDSGWSPWDIEVFAHRWTELQLCTVQEDHGSGRRLMRLRYHVQWSKYSILTAGMMLLMVAATVQTRPFMASLIGVALVAGLILAWQRGLHLAAQVAAIVDNAALNMGMIRCFPEAAQTATSDQEGERRVTDTAHETQAAQQESDED